MENKENQLIFFLIGFMVISITGIIIYFNNITPNNNTTENVDTKENSSNKQENTKSTNNSENKKLENADIQPSSTEKIAINIARDNAYGYLNQINKSVVQKSFKDSTLYNLNGTYKISKDGKTLSNENETYEIYYTGTYPSGGTLIFQNDKIQENSEIIVNDFTFKTDQNGNLIYN